MQYLAGVRAFVTSLTGAIIIALAVLLVVQTVRIEGFKFWPLSIDGFEKELQDERDGRKADREAYKASQDKARERMRAENKRIEAEQEQINDRVEADLNARIERLRRELRAETAKGRPGSGGASGVSPSPQGTDGEARVCFAPDVVLRAAENEERHEQLIKWVEEQLKVKR